MDAAAELRFSLSIKMSRLTRDGTAEPVSRDQILRRERGLENIHFSCSVDHVQYWQPYPVDPYSCFYICVTIHDTKFSGANGDREILNFPIQLTTSRIGNLARLIHTLLYVMTIHTYIHSHVFKHVPVAV